jgi:hypothetical protein
MLGSNQEQQVGEGSTAIQAQGDIKIEYHGPSVTEIKELCLLFLRDNFPKLKEEAIKAAEDNVRDFASLLENKILQQSETIVLDKFKDPDVQAAINDAVQASARKGKKANPELLVNLISERASVSQSDYKDIVISEAILIAPKLTKEQIAYLSFIHFMTHVGITGLQHVSQIEPYSMAALKVVSSGFDLSDSQRRHIQYAGTCSIASMMKVDIYNGWMTQLYKYMNYQDIAKFKSDIESFTPSTKLLLDKFEQDSNSGQVTLTSVGQAIAIANLSNTLGRLDYSIWIK